MADKAPTIFEGQSVYIGGHAPFKQGMEEQLMQVLEEAEAERLEDMGVIAGFGGKCQPNGSREQTNPEPRDLRAVIRSGGTGGPVPFEPSVTGAHLTQGNAVEGALPAGEIVIEAPKPTSRDTGGGSTGAAATLPKVDDLDAALQGMSEADIRAMKARDERKGAAKAYDKRLAEFDKQREEEAARLEKENAELEKQREK